MNRSELLAAMTQHMEESLRRLLATTATGAAERVHVYAGVSARQHADGEQSGRHAVEVVEKSHPERCCWRRKV